MQNHGQAPGYQRPGSTTSFTGQQTAPPPVPPPPPGYGASQGYQTSTPQAHGQWAAPTPTHTSNPWGPSQQQETGGYNPGTYGTMPGAQHQSYHSPPHQDQPPPPPPKPHGFAAAVQRQEQQQQSMQNWSQQWQQNPGYTPEAQQGAHPAQGIPPQPHHHAAPPPPLITPGASYLPSPQGGRPSSMYGTAQPSSHSNAPPAGPQPSTFISPNQQQQPPLSGQGAQAYMSTNANPVPGIYFPPPPEVPTWQQAQHAPLLGVTDNFTHTRPTADPGSYAQGYHSAQQQQQQQPPLLPPRHDQQSVQHPEYHQPQHGHSMPGQYLPPSQFPSQQRHHQYQGHFGGAVPAHQQSVGQPAYPQAQPQQQPVQQQYGHSVYEHHGQPTPHTPHLERPWQSASSAPEPDYRHNVPQTYKSQQQPLQPGYQAQGSFSGHYSQISNQEVQEPKPPSRIDTATPNFYHQPSPQSQPVSPISNRPSVSSASGYQHVPGRTESVSSIALANLYAQRIENKTSSPKPHTPKLPIPPPPRDDKSRFSVLAAGAPSDWEHLGGNEEIDDEELFGVKKEGKKGETISPESVELPAHVPSPPSTHGFLSPAVRPAHVSSSEWDQGYTPTPPSVTIGPAERQDSKSSGQGFVVEDAIVAPLRTTLKPIQNVKPHHQPAALTTGFVSTEGGWQASQHTPTQPKHHFETQTSNEFNGAGSTSYDYTAELKEKDDLIRQLRADADRERAELQAKIELLEANNQRLISEFQANKTHSASEMIVLRAQIETMRTTADQASVNSDALVKEKNLTIERLKEDVEGKERNIEERDELVAELKSQLEAEKTRQWPKPTPADLIPDIDPWYVGSLERYIAMLLSEAAEPQVEEKIKTFKKFMKVESSMRAIVFLDASTQTLPVEPEISHPPEQAARSRATSSISATRQDLNIQVPQESTYVDDYEYSPGGRPILARQSTIPPIEDYQSGPKAPPSVQSTTILTPTSSVDDDTNKTPVQSPSEEQMQPQYKAYAPPASISIDPPQLRHRQTMSFSNPPGVASPSGRSNSKGHDEIFFGAHQPTVQTPATRSSSSEADVPLPAPLTLTPRHPVCTAVPSKGDPNTVLKGLLPKQIKSDLPNCRIQDLRAKLANIGSESSDPEELTKTLEKSASLYRRKKDDARRRRQEENEEHNEELFNNNEISYAEMKQLEEEFKQKERELKAQEDKDEYKSYVDIVFDPVFNGSHGEIKALMDLYVEAKHLLQFSVTGLKSFKGTDDPSTKDCFELLRDIHEQIEKRHESVVQLVAERDKRYKKTETQPLYAAGNISQMKSVEKHYEKAEKQAVFKAKHEKAERAGELVQVVEGIIVDAVSTEQREVDYIIAAIKDLEDGTGDAEILTHAQSTLKALKTSSKALLSLFNALEIESNNADIDAEIAQVKADGPDSERLRELEAEKKEAERESVEEFERRIRVLEGDESEIAELVQRKTAKSPKDVEKEERLRMALEEAKRRNGHA